MPACRSASSSCSTRAYAEYVRRNDYESGIELAAADDNVVMTRTFSKIYGLAGLRIGWGYGPAAVIDALNRIRGPFNVSSPAIAAGVAALRDRAHLDMSVAHNEAWLPKVTAALQGLGLEVTPSVAQFRADPFPRHAGQDRGRCRRVPARRAASCSGASPPTAFPNALRMTIGSEEANRRRSTALADSSARRRRPDAMAEPIFQRLALIGIGLIGGSIALGARKHNLAGHIAVSSRTAKTLARAEGARPRRLASISTPAEAVRDADCVILSIPVGASGDGRRGDRRRR